MKTILNTSSCLAGFALITFGTAANCAAQNASNAEPYPYKPAAIVVTDKDRFSRDHRPEFYLVGQYWHAESSVAHNVTVPTSTAVDSPTLTGDLAFKFKDTGLGGVGLGYNFNKHWAANAEFTLGNSDYTLTFAGSQVTGDAFIHGGKFNIDYNILAGPITPFVSAGLGYLYVDTGVPSGPTTFNCWWDYWWGETCVGNTPTYRNTYFTLNGALGVRWDITDRFFMKAGVGANWVDVHNSAAWLDTLQGNFIFGWKF